MGKTLKGLLLLTLIVAPLAKAEIKNKLIIPEADMKLFPSVVEMSLRKNSSRTTNRSIGEVNLLAPIFQKQDSFYFMNYIGKRTNSGGAELNIGLGRRQLKDNVISGLYGFIDVRKTPLRNRFWQLTLGQEHLSKTIDWRYNLYIPFSGRKSVPQSKRKPKVIVIGDSLNIQSLNNEYAMHGIDFEVGHKKPYPWGSFALWLGGYSFHNKHVSSINGPSVRIETELTNLKYLPKHATLKWGMQFQRDNVRGENLTAQIGLSIALSGTSRLSYMQRRMIEPVIRDVDIVSNTDSITESAVNLETGKALNKIKKVRTGADLYRATKLGDANTLVVIEDDIATSLEAQAQEDQVFISGNRKVLLTTASGATVAYQPSSGPTRAIRAVTNGQTVFKGNKGVINKGVTVTNKDDDGRNVPIISMALRNEITITANKGTSFNPFSDDISGSYTYSLECVDDYADCDNISIDRNTGVVTLDGASTGALHYVKVTISKDGRQSLVDLTIHGSNAAESADEEKDNLIPNQEKLNNGVTLQYGNNFRCAGDDDAYGGTCDTSRRTKINYIKNMINSLLSKKPEVASKIIASLKRNNPILTLFNKENDKDSARAYLGLNKNTQDLQADETFAGSGNDDKGLSADGSKRNAALEEIIHLIQNYGITDAFPEWQERLDKATTDALAGGKLSWDSDDLERRDLDDEYFADAVEAYFNIRGGKGVIKTDSVCSSGGAEGGDTCSGDNTARSDLKRNHRAMYDLVEEIFGKGNTLF